MKPMYCVILESGKEYNVYAESAKEAWSNALEIWPELMGKDVRDVRLVE